MLTKRSPNTLLTAGRRKTEQFGYSLTELCMAEPLRSWHCQDPPLTLLVKLRVCPDRPGRLVGEGLQGLLQRRSPSVLQPSCYQPACTPVKSSFSCPIHAHLQLTTHVPCRLSILCGYLVCCVCPGTFQDKVQMLQLFFSS